MLTTNLVKQLRVRSVKLCHCQTSSLALSAVRLMSSNRKEHLELTSDQYRVKHCVFLGEKFSRDCVQDPGAVPAQVVAIENLSGTVKGLKLRVEQKIIDGGLHFKPGQWLDFFISGQEQVRNQNQNTSYNSNLNSPLRPGWRFLHV